MELPKTARKIIKVEEDKVAEIEIEVRRQQGMLLQDIISDHNAERKLR